MSALHLVWFLPVCWAFWRGLMAMVSKTLDDVLR